MPMVWLLIAIPSSAVIMGIIMGSLAINSEDGLVTDDYYQQGKEINRSLLRDQKASDYALHAQLYWVDEQTINVRVYANNPLAYDGKEVLLGLRHPTRQGLDKHAKLTALGGGLYKAQIGKALKRGRWKVELSTDVWRLQGRLQWPQQQRLLLRAFGQK